MTSEYGTILEQLFSTSESEVETFMDVIKDSVSSSNMANIGNSLDGQADKIGVADILTQKSGFIQIGHGWHGDDYVWHISPFHPKKPWKVSIDRVCYSIAKVMNKVIPQDMDVKFWLPYAEWDIKEVTFKSIDLKKCWNVQEKEIRKMTIKLFEVLNTLV